jgi:subtilisin family serine protease
VTAALAASVLPATSASATTEPRPAAAGLAPLPGALTASGAAAAGLPPGPHTVTLISGDKVTLAVRDGGRLDVRTDPAVRPDGQQPVMFHEGGPDGIYVFPSDAVTSIQAGRLDRELFNVKALIRYGYTDAARKDLPVLVRYSGDRTAAALRAAADALPAGTPTRTLTSVDAAAVTVPKAAAGAFWTAIDGAAPGARTLGGGIDKVWLDGQSKLNLAESVPLIGAPEAWQAGHDGSGVTVAVLDSGIDDNHPDVAGKVAESRSFLPGVPTARDDHGHGTHVASTIAGTGAADNGRLKGVAPGARLVVGKVCAASGSCPDSAVLAGMEWAAHSGAKIVNMSLGGGPTDGTDVKSRAVNELTAATGTLFVVAAGNSGPRAESVGTPGAADAALTVAATQKDDALASFSSRGPRLDGAIKPDIAAPGQHIAAARAEGTAMCESETSCVQPEDGPVDENYTKASGTSMATPHIAGAAAVVAQQHPEWTAGQLKAALMSTAKDTGRTPYEQGAGRVDVARADRQRVFAATPNLDFGIVPAGQPPAGKEITYTNLGDRPVTLTLTPTLRGSGGDLVEGALAVDRTVTVPAGGTASVTATLDVDGLTNGRYTGALVAADDATGTRLTTPIGLAREPAQVALTVRTLNSQGEPADPGGTVSLLDVAGDRGSLTGRLVRQDAGVYRARISLGRYQVSAPTVWADDLSRPNIGWLLAPEVTVDGDTEVVLDARRLRPLSFRTSRPAETIPNNNIYIRHERTTAAGQVWAGGSDAASFYNQWITPTARVTTGKFLLHSSGALGHPEVMLRMHGGDAFDLHPVVYPHQGPRQNGGLGFIYTPFSGKRRLELVDAGQGRPEDIAGRDLRGKLALVKDVNCALQMDRVHNVRDAGAAGIVAWPGAEAGRCGLITPSGRTPTIPLGVSRTAADPSFDIGIPYVSIPRAEAERLAARLAARPVEITVTGTPQDQSPYNYHASAQVRGQVPDSPSFDLSDRNVATIDADVHSAQSGTILENTTSYALDQLLLSNVFGPQMEAPVAGKRRYVGPLYDNVIRKRRVNIVQGPVTVGGGETVQVFDRPARLRERWNNSPATPGAIIADERAYGVPDPQAPPGSESFFGFCSFCRAGDTLWPTFYLQAANGQNQGAVFAPDATLTKDGVPVPSRTEQGIRVFSMPKEPGTYQYTVDFTQQGRRTTSAWTFRSETVTAHTAQPGVVCVPNLGGSTTPCRPEPLVFATFDLGDSAALDTTVAAGRPHHFTMYAYHSRSTGPMPKIAGARVWYSTDDGATWRTAPLSGGKDGRYTIRADYPALAATSGAVSVKVEAWDSTGNRLEQTTLRAFPLRAPRAPS